MMVKQTDRSAGATKQMLFQEALHCADCSGSRVQQLQLLCASAAVGIGMWQLGQFCIAGSMAHMPLAT